MNIDKKILLSVTPDFQIHNGQTLETQLAHAYYQQSLFEKGWNYLYIYANENVDLVSQHRGAGYLQGYAEYEGIYNAYKNLSAKIIKESSLKAQAQHFVDKQLEYIEKKIKEQKEEDIYWQYAEAYLEHLKSIHQGYIARVQLEKKQEMMLDYDHFYYLTNVGDLQDLIPAYHDRSQMKAEIQKQNTNCNIYVKVMPSQDILVAHSTHNIYQFMIRTLKTYHFPTNNKQVGSNWFSFSSRPGDLISKDDFYILDSGMIVTETSLTNMNQQNYQDLHPNTVPCWLRQTIATNLARNPQQWAQYFLKESSGTHNNQWVIVENSLNINEQGKIKKVLFVEQGFLESDIIDMSKRLNQKQFLGSYNIPYSEKIQKKLGYQKYPSTYETDKRAFQLGKYDDKISSVEDLKLFLLNNPDADPSVGLAPRYDKKQQQPRVFGLTDLKIISTQTIKKGYMEAYSGPCKGNGRFEPFDWKQWPNQPSYGMPRRWDFPWQQYYFLKDAPKNDSKSQIK